YQFLKTGKLITVYKTYALNRQNFLSLTLPVTRTREQWLTFKLSVKEPLLS
ncbi:Hypothetical predicted protein, partial [Paramuricea clavata]